MQPVLSSDDDQALERGWRHRIRISILGDRLKDHESSVHVSVTSICYDLLRTHHETAGGTLMLPLTHIQQKRQEY